VEQDIGESLGVTIDFPPALAKISPDFPPLPEKALALPRQVGR